jgi:hypothetical protein
METKKQTAVEWLQGEIEKFIDIKIRKKINK